jgi:hypothetical protein
MLVPDAVRPKLRKKGSIDMSKSFKAVLLAVSLAFVGACGGDDSGGGTPDAGVSLVDAPNNTIDSGGGSPDADTSMAATHLGQVCNQATPCPTGYTCSALEMGATSGLCTNTCTMSGMEDTCGAASGFAGPGVGYCGLSNQAGMHFCAIGCGEQNGGNTMCPTGLTCKDLINMNGMGDLCAP